MNDTKIKKPKIKNPKIEVDEKILEDIKSQTDKEKQVIVHCYFYPEQFFSSKGYGILHI